MLNWTKDQWDAYGRHILTAATSVIATLAAVGVISAAKAAEYVADLTVIVTSLVALAATLGPLYAAWRAARSASPEKQAEQTVKNIEAGVPINGKKEQLIETLTKSDTDKVVEVVAQHPEVKNVEMVDKQKAREIPGDKVI